MCEKINFCDSKSQSYPDDLKRNEKKSTSSRVDWELQWKKSNSIFFTHKTNKNIHWVVDVAYLSQEDTKEQTQFESGVCVMCVCVCGVVCVCVWCVWDVCVVRGMCVCGAVCVCVVWCGAC